MDQFSGSYSVVIAVVGIFGWVASIAAYRALLALDRESPEVLRGVGVSKVDLGFKCLRGGYFGLLAAWLCHLVDAAMGVSKLDIGVCNVDAYRRGHVCCALIFSI
ncbi:hypothetical protein ABH900_001727 [Stenotrophomonas sp. AN71]|uniref:hypothetical protein n=1 Tax=Stenotrophomonas sp. AN71 TaxID=3156253 RepID=UPI003D1A3319